MEKVDINKLQDCVNQMTQIINNIDNNLSNIKNQFNSVTNSWEGEAASEYVKKTKNITNEYESYLDEMKKCRSFLISIISTYSELEKSITF